MFAFFYVWVAPPVPLSSGLGWLPVSRVGSAHQGLILVFFGVALLVWVPARQGLTPLVGFSLFSFFHHAPAFSLYGLA